MKSGIDATEKYMNFITAKKKKNNTAAENQVQLYGDMLEFLE